MSWSDEYGTHEAWVAPEFADGVRGIGVLSGRVPDDEVIVEQHVNPGRLDTDTFGTRPAADVVGWRVICECRDPDTGSAGPQWASSLVERVPSPARSDILQGRLYAVDVDVADVDSIGVHQAGFVALWKRDHLNAQSALAAIVAARRRAAEIEEELDAAVAAARAAGESWEAIGRAAGIARQSAHQRWG
ncbi:MAG TPA: hypothetical protein VM575_09510 [Nocardioides sp.]|nr:hypothetical protein [Nocardioides sp.]